MTTALFHFLPDDIFKTILYDWIGSNDVESFAALDIAMCNRHCREQYYSLLVRCPIDCNFLWWQSFLQKGVSRRFQAFMNWLKLRGMQLVSLPRYYSINLLHWEDSKKLKELSLFSKEEEVIDLNIILTNLPGLQTFELDGDGLIVFSIQTFPLMLKLKKIALILLRMKCCNLTSLLETLGRSAKMLVSMELTVRETNYDHFYDALRCFQFVDQLKFSNCAKTTTSERYLEMRDNHDGFPNIRDLWFRGDEAAILPLLPKFSNLTTFSMYGSKPFSREFVCVLSKSLPVLKILKLINCCSADGVVTLLSSLPPNTLEILKVVDVNDECLNLISTRQVMLQTLVLSGGHIAAFQSDTLSFSHLQELSLSFLTMSDEMYAELWSNATTFPALHTLKLGLDSIENDENDDENDENDDENDVCKIVISLLTSPLHTQLVNIKVTAANHRYKWIKGIDWNNIPIWEKLEETSWDGIRIFQLDQVFQHFPNLRTLVLYEVYGSREAVTLCKELFQHAKRLEYLRCFLCDKLSPTPTGEYEIWKGIIEACPRLRYLIMKYIDGSSYWDVKNAMTGHVQLIQEYRHRIFFFKSQ